MRPVSKSIATTILIALARGNLETSYNKADNGSREFVLLQLPEPSNWQAGDRLFPELVIAGFHAHLDDYNDVSWTNHVMDLCVGFEFCTSILAFQATNSGDPKVRYWFGYAFAGGPTTEADYVRNDDVSNSAVYTVPQVDGGEGDHGSKRDGGSE
ncbi:hypothetical protein QBC34DRAFT_377000 [Podospora aff. communis PSN243]|uniref:Uncharacterized protein n=1 Tax=Podospora aff. communis PSN243 TaxID=3040156 RepID=A0AAV9GW35_9PEZI|nr:hypothetical protein QBC34DRAFT_377000 [Podospora aff. communis PSN243]